MKTAFWIASILAVYPYCIFPAIILLACRLIRRRHVTAIAPSERVDQVAEPISIIIAAYNEADKITEKLTTTLALLGSNMRSEIVVISDHSTDATLKVAADTGDARVRAIENFGPRGRAGSCNLGVELARNEIALFSDVETQVPEETVAAIVQAIMRPNVGCVNATIVFENEGDNRIAQAAALYWRFELWLRSRETDLGLYAMSSGPCMAIRRSLFKPLPVTGDVDFTTPLDVVEQGFLCVHLSGSRAYDRMPQGDRAEFRARVRMVSKNISGTVSRWGWKNLLFRPLYSWVIYSHKILRWLTPFFLLICVATSVMLIGSGWIYDAIAYLQAVFYGVAGLGWLASRRNRHWPVVSTVYAFVLVNAAFFVGVCKAVIGMVPAWYLPTRREAK